jgi:O-antigen/teichoic acid export membrane protein
MLCQCGVTVVASAFFVTKQTAAWMRVMLAGLAIQVLAVLLLARPLGIPGVALALAGAQAFLYWAAARFGGRLWPVPYRHREAILTMGVASAVSVVRIWLPGGPLWLAATVDAALVGGYLVLALPLCRVGRGELALLRSWLLDRGSTR